MTDPLPLSSLTFGTMLVWRDEVGVHVPGSANLASFNQDMTDAHPWRSDEVRTKEMNGQANDGPPPRAWARANSGASVRTVRLPDDIGRGVCT